MALTPEVKVKRKVVQTLKALGAYYFYPVTSGFGASGVPDIVICYRGRFFGIECKAGKNKPNALQQHNLNAIIAAGGVAIIINEENVDALGTFLERSAPLPAQK
jgi:Holliday junction resolvase